MAEADQLAVFVGGAAAPNVGHVLDDFAALVPGDHHLVTTHTGHNDRPYTVFGTERPSTLWGATRALENYLRQHDPAVLLQVTRPPVHGSVAGALAKRHGVAFVYRYSGDRFYEYRVARGRQCVAAFALGAGLGRLPIRLADHHVALGPVGRRRLIARGVDPDRIAVLPPAVDLDRSADPDPVSLDVPDDRRVVLLVGRLSHLKGAATLERTIPRALDRRSDLQFVIVGDVVTALDLPEWAREHVTGVGPVEPDRIPGYMAAAEALFHPSLTEGVPRVLLESLAVGTPVLARDVGDVASVTDNTFERDDALPGLLADVETLPLDDVTPFTRESLAPAYRNFFQRWQRPTYTTR